jgi:hypothetical protein
MQPSDQNPRGGPTGFDPSNLPTLAVRRLLVPRQAAFARSPIPRNQRSWALFAAAHSVTSQRRPSKYSGRLSLDPPTRICWVVLGSC